MDIRLLARGLRARPTPWLLNQQPRFQQSFLTSTLRYNSSSSTPSQPPKQTPSNPSEQSTQQSSEPTTPAAAPKPQENANSASDFDEILNKLDLGNRGTPTDAANRRGRRGLNDSVSENVASLSASAGKHNQERMAQQLASRKMELKLGPTLGRQIHVEPERGVDLAAAIRNLQITCSTNKIKAQSFEQRFHKRKGAVRKEQKRMRWKKLFKFSFQETVKKIQRMQTQGW
ncbi:hypothetical protein N7509_005598 [Penicillium cosmopolitanum]|uniref:Ribosomal protein S21 n=1 Tax=Penicillium cosmopolitanum TaxID=1131564 RepID=A0A9X0BA79_9EURO|nr:uncharacterized protein N7509_005598 [Penicillium cosmopolitanum]KAJ5397485.1 hypothetical protein N7509_005598 [Penicillium cosmopolitanum]